MQNFITEPTTLFHFIELTYLHPTREKIELYLKERDGLLYEEDKKDKLFASLNEEQKNLAKHYAITLENRMDELHFLLELNLFHLGIQIGMELKDSFFNYEQ